MGWLHATPKSPTKKVASKAKEEARWNAHVRIHKKPPPLPEVDFAEELLEYLQEIGLSASSGMGITAVPVAEIHAWASSQGIELTAWQSRTLRMMSEAYCRAYDAGSDPACPAPWQPVDVDRDAVATGVRGLFAAMRKRKGD